MPPFAAPAGAGDRMSHLPAPEPARVPFANITAAAEPRPLLFASPLSAPDAGPVTGSAAPAEYRSVLLPAEPADAPSVHAASPAPATDVDFSTVMMPRLSTAQLEAAQSPLAGAIDASPAGDDPVVAQSSGPVAAQAADPVVEPPAVEASEPVVAVATPPIRLKLRDDPPVAPAIPLSEEPHVAADAPAAATPSPVAGAEAAQPTVESKSESVPAQSQKPAAAKAKAASSSPAKPRSSLRGLATAAAVLLIVGAIGVPLGRLWLGRGQQIVPVAATAPRPAATPAPKQPVAPQAVPAAATAATAAAAAPAPAAAAPVKTTPPAATRKPPTRADAKPAAAEPQVPQIAAVAPTFVAEAPPAAVLPPPEPVAPALVAPAMPESPIGPFYETRSVDQAPQVTHRVEPRLPASLQGQPLKEIVIVRVLVSQTGKAALTSVLRRSKAGLELDNAVLAAVRQWSFTPATKKGAAVSCFLHVGVTVGE
jgi:TonB family protein